MPHQHDLTDAGIENANAQLAADCLALLHWLRRRGVPRRMAANSSVCTVVEGRVTGVLAELAQTAFEQALPGDAEVFDLFDEMCHTWPDRVWEVPGEFLSMRERWRATCPFEPGKALIQVNLQAHRRALKFIGGAS